MGVRGQFAIGVAGTGIDVNSVMLQNEIPVAPTLKGVEVVGTHDEAELFVAVFFAQMGQSEHSVGGYGQVEFDIAGAHAVVVVHGKTHHLEPLLVGEEGLALLEGVLGGDYKPHFVKFAMGQHRVADDEVTDVYRIEGAEEKAYLAHGG